MWAVFGYGALMLSFEVEQVLATWLEVGLLVVLLASWMWAVYVTYEFRRRLAQAPDGALDERERTVRDRAYLQSHRILTLGIFVVAVLALVLANDVVTLDGGLLRSLLMAAGMGALVLPSAIVAWQEPDDLELEVDGPTPTPVGTRS